MRKSLVAAVALAPLCLAASRGTALATDTISNGVNTPVATATATSGGPDSIDVASGGSVSISSSGSAVTLNSGSAATPNNVTVEGSVNLTGVNNSVAIQGLGGAFGDISSTSSITNTESYSPTANNNGLNQAPFASTGSTGRFGIQISGTGTFNGSINNAGTLTVQGNNSFGISVETPMSGGLTNSGTISYTGDGGAAIRSTAGSTIGGQVLISGAITALGGNPSNLTNAINLQGGENYAYTGATGTSAGGIAIYSSITNTGYATTTRPVTTSTLSAIESNNSGNLAQVLQSGSAVVIGGPVAGGVFIGAPPVGTTTSTGSTVDLDGDGIPDIDEGVGQIINYGSAAAMTIGGASNNPTVLGVVGGTDTSAAAASFGSTNNYGLLIEGSIAGEGVFDGVTATGLQVGGLGGAVNINGGIRVVGSISADSYQADATAIHIYSGAAVPEIRNEDFIESSVSTTAATVTNPTELAGLNASAMSTGILIDKGASVSTFNNFGTLQATANGDTMSAKALVDSAGSITSVTNEGVISAVVTPVTTGLVFAPGSGAQVALDLSANTTGVNLTQQVNPNPVAISVSTTTNAAGVVTTTAAFSTVTSSSTTTVTTTTAGVTTTTTTTTPTYPQIVGDVLLGSGTNNVAILGGSVTGALSLGGGTGGSLTVGDANDAAVITGPVTFTGSGLALSVVNGSIYNTSATTMHLSSLSVSGKGSLFAALDPVNGVSTQYVVSGAATLASGAQIGIVLNSPLYTAQTFNIIQAGSLTDNTGGALSSSAIPYLITGTESSNAATGTISLDLRPKTAAEMGLNPAESAALSAIYKSLVNDPQIENAVLNQYTKSSFLNVYDQLLPDYAGGLFQLTLAASDAVTRATSRVNDIANPSGTRGAWAEEVAFGVNRDRSSESAGYQGGGFGFVAGAETGGAGLGAFGVTGSFLTGDSKDPHAPGENLESFSEGEGGVYWQGQLAGIRADARLGAGYVLYSDRREFLLKDAAGDVSIDRAAKGSSSGYTVTGHFGVGYQTPQIGWFYFRPQVHGDYFRLQEGGFSEHGGEATATQDGFDLALASKTGDETSGTASLVTGVSFGQSFQWRPELELGYRDVFTGNAGDTTAQFVGGTPFTLPADDIKGGGPVARLDVKADTDFYELNFEAGVEQRTHFEEGDLRISVRVLF